MATANNSSFDGFLGRQGNTVTYLRCGKIVRRTIGIPTGSPTKIQRKYRTQTPLTNDFLAPVSEFYKIGFKLEAQLAKKTSRDLIDSYTRLNCIKGQYPNQEIDFTKALFSKGKMPETPGIKAELNENGLEFTWDTKLIPGKFRNDDQVMLLVYFPELNNADYTISGGARSKGSAQFSLLKNEEPTLMEAYISFISADHKKISDSIYTGQFILPAIQIIAKSA